MKHFVAVAIVALTAVAGSMSIATAADQHRVYPGSDSAQAQQARAARLAPNYYCDKHENECQ